MIAVYKKLICCCYDEFFDKCIYQINDLNNFIHLHRFSLNLYNYNKNSWVFCCLCYDSVRHNSIFKFFSKNLINIITCQNYLSVLKDFTTIKKYLIMKYHSVNIIFKLWSNDHVFSMNYNALQKYIIIIFQDLESLLQILSSSELRLNNIIKIFWLNKFSLMSRDLKLFLNIWKNKILIVLHYLV